MSFIRLLHYHYLLCLYSFNIYFILVCGESVTFDNVDKDITISTEEILRRRMLVKQHLTKYEEGKKDWIETYHLSFSDSDNFLKKAIPKYSILEENTVNDISSSIKKIDSTVESEEIQLEPTNIYNPSDDESSISSNKIVEPSNIGEVLKIGFIKSDDINVRNPAHIFDKTENSAENNQNLEKNSHERVHELKNADLLLQEHTNRANDENDNSNNNNELYKQSDINFAGSVYRQILVFEESDSVVMYSDYPDNSVLEVSKSVQLTMQSSKVNSLPGNVEKTEIPDSFSKFESDSDILTPNKILQPVLEESSKFIADKPENNHYYKNDMLPADFIQPTDLKSQTISNPQTENSNLPKLDDLSLESVSAKNILKSKGVFSLTHIEKCPNVLSNFKNIILSFTVLPHCKMTDVVKSKLATNHVRNSENYFFAHSTESLMQKNKISGLYNKANHDKHFEQFSNHQKSKEIGEYTQSTSKGEKNIPTDFNKNTLFKETLPTVSDELLRRKRLIKPFISSLNKKNENWKETHDFIYKSLDSGEVLKSFEDLHKTENKRNSEALSRTTSFFKPTDSVEKEYLIHWFKRFYNKFVYYHDIEEIKITLSFSSNILKDLEELMSSETFDVTQADEFLSSLIKNASIIQNYDTDDFSFVHTSVGFYITASIILLVLIYSLLLHFPITRIMFPIIGLLLWHGWKMYSEKLAGKHAVLSSTAPEYCQNILNLESGIFAHFKEFLRSNMHDDQCQKYFRALMTDPLSELSVSIVVSDFISSTFFQFFIPLGRTLNILVKDSFSDLGFISAFYLFILIILIFGFGTIMLMICYRYKFNFPFFLGTAEPTAVHPGSRVEDLQIKPSAKEQYFLKSYVYNKYYMSLTSRLKHSGKSLTFNHNKDSRLLIRRLSI